MAAHIDQAGVIERIRFLIRRSRLTQAAFSKRLGIDPTNMSKHLNGKLPVTEGLVNRIAVDLGVSKRWLLDGSETPYAKQHSAPDTVAAPTGKLGVQVPVYDIDVTAGGVELSRLFTSDRVIGAVSLPRMSRDSAIVHVSGDSMTPDIRHGSYIAIRPVTDASCIFWGQIYVIVMDDYRMVKFLRRHPSDENLVVLHSANPAYDDMVVSKTDIRSLYLVEAIMNFDIRC